MLHIQRRANGGPSIVRCGLNVHVSKVRSLEDHAISHAIQRHSACQANRCRARLLLNKIQHRKVVLFEHRLHGCGEVLVALLDFGPGHARFAKNLCHLVRKDRAQSRFPAIPSHLHALAVMCEVVQIQAALISLGADQAPHLFGKARLAISGEAHHLVFVAVLGKAEKLRKSGVEKAQRVRESDGAVDIEVVAFADCPT